MRRVQTKPLSPLCYANRSNEQIEGEEEEGGGEEEVGGHVGFHQRLVDVFKSSYLSSLVFQQRQRAKHGALRERKVSSCWARHTTWPQPPPSCGPPGASARVTRLCGREALAKCEWGMAKCEWGETLTRSSPEPRAAAHLPLQSGASAMQGDSEENADGRGG